MAYVLKLICKNGENCVRPQSQRWGFDEIISVNIREAHAEGRKRGWHFEKKGQICNPCYLQRELTREPKRHGSAK